VTSDCRWLGLESRLFECEATWGVRSVPLQFYIEGLYS
jgi:hypothetical protein